jgi:hypothetical protein
MPVESSISQDQPINVKLLMLGLESVGKSSLLLRFTDQQWLPEHEMVATIGVDTWVNAPFSFRPSLAIDSLGSQSHKLDVKGKRVNLTVWVRPRVRPPMMPPPADNDILRDRTLQVWSGSGQLLPHITVGHKESYWVRLRLSPISAECSTDLRHSLRHHESRVVRSTRLVVR